tara:strand:+ start:36 stop:248 length:213 start_codon:yes stop_codon:yes gene_type:complete
MKKILFSIIFTHILTLNSYAVELKDCSIYSKLNPKYLACIAANFAQETKNYQTEQWSEEKTKVDKLIRKD